MLCAIFRAATVHVPKPPANRSAKAINMRREAAQIREAEVAHINTSCLS